MTNTLILGANAAVAHELGRRFAVRGDRLILVDDDLQKLEAIAADLRVLGAKQVSAVTQDLADIADYDTFVQTLINLTGQLDLVLMAHDCVADQAQLQQLTAASLHNIQRNGLSYIGLLTPLANYFEKQGSGCIVVITSNAGDRGRQSRYIYGAAISMVNTFCQGLRNRLHKANVQVLTIKLGDRHTPIDTHTPTATHPPKKTWLPCATAEQIADGILIAMHQKKDVVYLPKFWRLIMLLIQHIPERIFKKLSL